MRLEFCVVERQVHDSVFGLKYPEILANFKVLRNGNDASCTCTYEHAHVPEKAASFVRQTETSLSFTHHMKGTRIEEW